MGRKMINDYKILNKIKCLDDFKQINKDDMVPLADEIRSFLIESISKTGGHLASNLGVVELTMALHKSFDSPTDKIIWDVGHQGYVHKLLTGRMKQFSTLRQKDGMSGFLKRCESEHDIFEAGHSSTSISAASGFAQSRDLKGDKNHVVAVIGDGAMSGGMAFEGLNYIGHDKTPVIVVLNDNQMSISKNVGGLARHLGDLRTDKRYVMLKKKVNKGLKKIPLIGKFLAETLDKFKVQLKYLLVPGILFEEMGFTYLGPVDGHDIDDLIKIFGDAKRAARPVLVHIMTNKGMGYKPAEEDPEIFHGAKPFEIGNGNFYSSKKIGWSEAFGWHLVDLAKTDKKIVAITAAMPLGTGLEPFKYRFPDRLYDVGIAEQHAVTMAAAMALEGYHPFVPIYSTFLQRAYDQISHDVCRQNLPVTLLVDRAGLVGNDGDTHQGAFDISYLSHIPNITILSPSTEKELRDMMDWSLNNMCPTAIRYPRGNVQKALWNEDDAFDLSWPMLYNGEDICIFAVGKMLASAYEAREIVAGFGIKAALYNARTVKPLDKNTLDIAADRYKLWITVEDNAVIGGFGSMISMYAAEKRFDVKLSCLGIPDEFIPHGDIEELYSSFGLDAKGIASSIKAFIDEMELKR